MLRISPFLLSSHLTFTFFPWYFISIPKLCSCPQRADTEATSAPPQSSTLCTEAQPGAGLPLLRCSAPLQESLESLLSYRHTLIHPDFSGLLSAYTVLSVACCSEVLNFELSSKPSSSLAKRRSLGSPFTSGLFLALCWLQILHPILRSCSGSTSYLTLTGTKGEIWKVRLLTFFLLTFLMQTKVWTKWQKRQQANTKH